MFHLSVQCKDFLSAFHDESVHVQPVLVTGEWIEDESGHQRYDATYVRLHLNVGKFARHPNTVDKYRTLLEHLDSDGRLRYFTEQPVYEDILAQALPDIPDDLDIMECYDLSCDPSCDPECRGAEWTRPCTPPM